ncbi:NTP transferase domain-containing protein [Candidatus Kaiserbacteria bacterium]|nr:MAG: NTP transferase domain-containing protein [Candidatus Kaiserbacteria bacterium]
MQAVFLVAGEGTRMRPLTYHVPKPMARAGGKNLVEHNIDNLPKEITEIIFVVGYLAEQIMNHFGDEYEGRKITYVRQKKLLGTAHALSLCQKHLHGRFIVLMGDDVYGKDDIKNCLQYDWAWLVKKVRGKFTGGRIIYDSDGNVTSVTEGKHNVKDGFVGTNLFVLGMEYFNYQMVPIKDGKEYGLPQTVALAAEDFPIKMVEAKNWEQISDMNDLKRLHTRISKGQ